MFRPIFGAALRVQRAPSVGRQAAAANIDAAAGAVEEVARIVAQIRRRWPLVRILLRADSGFAREELMAWCEANGVHFLFGLAKTDRLIAEIKAELEGCGAEPAYRADDGHGTRAIQAYLGRRSIMSTVRIRF